MKNLKKIFFFILSFCLFSDLFAKNINLDVWVKENIKCFFSEILEEKLSKNCKNFNKEKKKFKINDLRALGNHIIFLKTLATSKKISSTKYEFLEKDLENSADLAGFLSGIILYNLHLYEKSNEIFKKINLNSEYKSFYLEKLKNFYMANSYIILQNDEKVIEKLEKLINLEENINYKCFFVVNLIKFLKFKNDDFFVEILEKNIKKLRNPLLKNEIDFLLGIKSLRKKEEKKAEYFFSKIDFKSFDKIKKNNEKFENYFLDCPDFLEIFENNKKGLNLKEIFSNEKILRFYKNEKKKANFSKLNGNKNLEISKINFLYDLLITMNNLKNYKDFLKYYKIYKTLYKDLENVKDENLVFKFNEITNEFSKILLKFKKYDEIKNLFEKNKDLPKEFKINDIFYEKIEFYKIINPDFVKDIYDFFLKKDISNIYNLLEKYFLSFQKITTLKTHLEIKNKNFSYKIFIFLENKKKS